MWNPFYKSCNALTLVITKLFNKLKICIIYIYLHVRVMYFANAHETKEIYDWTLFYKGVHRLRPDYKRVCGQGWEPLYYNFSSAAYFCHVTPHSHPASSLSQITGLANLLIMPHVQWQQ